MPRSARTVIRLPGPLGGFSEQIHPDMIGPTNCQDCENVLALPGRLKKRWGIRQMTTAHIADRRIEGIWSGLTNPSSGAVAPLIILKASEADAYTTGALYRWKGAGAWVEITGATIAGNTSIFVPIGMLLETSQRALILADGSARAWRLELADTPRVRHCGIKAPASATISEQSGGTCPTGDYYIYVAYADEDQRPPNCPTNHPGLESNAIEKTIYLASNKTIRIVFPPPPGSEHWTHARVYVRRSNLAQSRAYYCGSWYKNGESHGGDNEIAELTSDDPNYQIDLTTPATHMVQASGNGAYDYPPTRNFVPEKMRYFAFWNGRGFWARDYESNIYHSDVFNSLGGGHPECLSGDFLPPIDGPVSLLAEYGDSLIIGTDRGVYAVTGTISSYTNAAAARLEALPPHSAVVTRTPGDLGPVAEGTGSYVVADGLLYFITRNGLARYEGPSVRPQLVGLAVQSELPSGATSTALRDSVLAHDPVKHIIYMIVREDVAGGKYSSDTDGTTGQVESYIYAYSYREPDRNTGFGRWTRLGRIGVTAAFNDNDRRYTMIGMRHPIGGPPRLLVGMRCAQDDPNDVNDADVYSEDPTSSADEDCEEQGSIADADVPWSWESGNWDLGLPERKKWIHHLSVKLKDNSGATNTLTVGESLDGATYQNASHKEDKTRIEKSIGGLAEQMSVKFSGDSQLDTEIFDYQVDAEPADVY